MTEELAKCPECACINLRSNYPTDSNVSGVGQHVRCQNCRSAVRVTDLIEVDQ